MHYPLYFDLARDSLSPRIPISRYRREQRSYITMKSAEIGHLDATMIKRLYLLRSSLSLSLSPRFALYQNAIYIVEADLCGTIYIRQSASRMKEGERRSQLHRSATISDGSLFPSPASFPRFRWTTLRNCEIER